MKLNDFNASKSFRKVRMKFKNSKKILVDLEAFKNASMFLNCYMQNFKMSKKHTKTILKALKMKHNEPD